ncbi:DUF3156 family protein [Brevibacillus sp. NRS-1366]|uniref:DUF3156 family protein n=1 Tax=Brevibacillus sp. NRS-1366 TaxID=3233899 RepID=UPI003D25B5BC
MNIYDNVEKRAALALSNLVPLFSLPLRKQDALYYRTGESSLITGWKIRYTRAKKWLNRIYKAEITYTFELLAETEEQFRLNWSPAKKAWTSDGGQGGRLADLLNKQREIADLLASVDMEKVELTQQGKFVTVFLVPIPGCFIWTLIPPIHYYVRLKPREAVSLKSIAEGLESAILQFKT